MAFRVFTIPGLGFTPAVFSKLDLAQEVEHLSWQVPNPKESLRAYACRMSETMGDLGEAPIAILGHSFGGILAQEIARHRQVDSVILISSMKSRQEIPLGMRAMAPIGMHLLFNRQVTLATLRFWGPLFGYGDKSEQALFRTMVSQQSNTTLRWQLRELSRWQGVELPHTTIDAFHGDNDRTLPFAAIKEPVKRIPGGNHMMVYGRHAELNPMIRECLQRRFSALPD